MPRPYHTIWIQPQTTQWFRRVVNRSLKAQRQRASYAALSNMLLNTRQLV